ncbi:MAG: hypothetical protein V9G13_05825 [Marmoricola sp.]
MLQWIQVSDPHNHGANGDVALPARFAKTHRHFGYGWTEQVRRVDHTVGIGGCWLAGQRDKAQRRKRQSEILKRSGNIEFGMRHAGAEQRHRIVPVNLPVGKPQCPLPLQIEDDVAQCRRLGIADTLLIAPEVVELGDKGGKLGRRHKLRHFYLRRPDIAGRRQIGRRSGFVETLDRHLSTPEDQGSTILRGTVLMAR